MPGMDLTPELFEKVEFTERRRGYDTEQVETFLEQAGTALAQLLGRVRQTEERAAGAEVRLVEMEDRLRAAEADAVAARTAAEAAPRPLDEEAEVEQAARTLLMARRTAEAIENEARDKAQTLLLEAKARADRQVQEAHTEAEETLARARSQADREGADRRTQMLDEVRELEARRVELTEIVGQLDARLAGYRDELTRAATELTALAEDPSRIGVRATVAVPPDEVIPAAEPVTGSVPVAEPVTGSVPVAEPVTGSVTGAVPTVDPISGSVPSVGVEFGGLADAPVDPATATSELAEVVPPASADSWGVSDDATVVDPEAFDAPVEEPVTGTTRDRFLDDLEQAINDPEPESDEAMTAFFEGSSDSRSRRFGWRR